METANDIATAASENPFFVLELPVSAGNQEIARQKQKLLGMLELGISSAKEHATPLGPKSRSPESVRRAAACLEKPHERILWELWAAGLSFEGLESEAEDVAVPELFRALRLHYQLQKQLMNQGEFDVAEFDELGEAWDEVLESEEFYEEVEQRADELSLEDSQFIIDEFMDLVMDDLVFLVENAPVCNLDEVASDLGIDAVSRYGQRATDLLEASCHRFVECELHQLRLRDGWNALSNQYSELVVNRGEYMRSLAFHTLEDPLSDFAVEVHSEGFYAISEKLFRWLRDEAKVLGDEETYELQHKNLRIAQDAQLQQTTYEPYESDTKVSGGASWGWIVAVIVIGMLRFCARDYNSTPDYDDYQIPQFNYELPQYDFDNLNIDDLDFDNLDAKTHDELMREIDEIIKNGPGKEGYEPDDMWLPEEPIQLDEPSDP